MKTPLAPAALILLVLGVGGIRSVHADETGAAPTLHPRHIELLPINDLERKELARDHPDLAGRLQHLKQRWTRLRGHLAQRKDPSDDGGRRLAEQIAQVERDMAPLTAKVVEACRPMHLTDALLVHMASAPEGSYHVARYAQSLVLFVAGMPQAQRRLFEGLVPRVEGALIALAAQKHRLATEAPGSDDRKQTARAASARIDEQVKAIEKRFWRLVDYAVPEAQRALIHHALPTAYQRQEDVLGHLYSLPQLSASQATRITALLTEIEAEAAPESALVKRLQQSLKQPDLGKADRARMHKEMAGAGQRTTELQRYAVVKAREILSKDQWTLLEAIPPRVSVGDRKQTSPQVLEGLTLTSDQRTQLDEMRAGLAGVRRAYREKRLAAAAKGADFGPDSPQMMSMRIAMANVEAEGNALQRQFNGRLFLELLTPQQVAQWVIAPSR